MWSRRISCKALGQGVRRDAALSDGGEDEIYSHSLLFDAESRFMPWFCFVS